MKARISLILTLVLSAGLAGPAAAQRQLTPHDVVMMRSVSGAYPSPDGTLVAFSRSEPRGPQDTPGGGYTTPHLLDGDHRSRPLATGKRNLGSVAWHPRGGILTFLERKEGDKGRQVYALSMSGGESHQVFSADHSISQHRWRPDGGAVAFTATLPAPAGGSSCGLSTDRLRRRLGPYRTLHLEPLSPGNHRNDPPPALDLDYGEWTSKR